MIQKFNGPEVLKHNPKNTQEGENEAYMNLGSCFRI